MMIATIAKASPRYSTWIYIFGTDTIRVTGEVTGPQGQKRILVDVDALTALQFQRLVVKFSRGWRLPSEQVRNEFLRTRSVPISAEDVTLKPETPHLFA